MQKNEFLCPHCHKPIDMSLLEEHRISELLKEREEDMEKDIKKRAFEWAQKEIELMKRTQQEIEEKQQVELNILKQRDEEARKKEMEFLKEKTLLEQKQKDLEIEKERALIEARKVLEKELADRMKKEQDLSFEKMAFEFEKKMLEKEKQIEQIQRSLEDANRKANQGSMQIQGDSQENALKDLLFKQFPFDQIEDVPTGIKGADIIQSVRSERGKILGIIAWESKATKAWQDVWVEKLKEDRLRVNANVSIIISQVLPDEIHHFGLYKGVWVTEWAYIIPLTVMIREQLKVMDQMRGSLQGKDQKMEEVYEYLTSVEFKNKIENIIEAFENMKSSLDQEKRAMEKIWSSREKQLDRVIGNTAKLYGDMQGIIGNELSGVKYFELPEGDNENIEI